MSRSAAGGERGGGEPSPASQRASERAWLPGDAGAAQGERREGLLRGLAERHDAAAGADLLQESERRRVTRVPGPDGPWVCKEERFPGWLRRLRRRAWGARVARGLEAARVLRDLGLPAPEPLALLELPGRSLAFFRWVPGPDLGQALAGVAPDRARELAWSAADLAARLHAAQVASRDLKPANLRLDAAGGLVLVDLDDVVRGPAGVRRYAWRNLAALDAYAQQGPRPLGVGARLEALRAYCARRELQPADVLAAVLPRSRAKQDLLRRRR